MLRLPWCWDCEEVRCAMRLAPSCTACITGSTYGVSHVDGLSALGYKAMLLFYHSIQHLLCSDEELSVGSHTGRYYIQTHMWR